MEDEALFDAVLKADDAPRAEPSASAPPSTSSVSPLPASEPSDARNADEAERQRDAPGQWFGYERAPIRWSGMLGLDYLKTKGSSAFLETLNLGGDSFVVAPYIVEVSGNLYVSRSQVRSEQQSNSDSLYGAGVISVFNRSRWPLRITIDGGEASTRFAGGGNSSTTRGIGIDQSYRPEDSSFAVAGRLGRSVFSSSAGDETIADSRSFTYTPTLRTEMPQTASISTSYSGFDRTAADGTVSNVATTQLNASHSINMEEWNGFRLDSMVNYSGLTDGATGASLRRTGYTQLSTAYSWLPEDPDSRLIVSGTLSANRFATEVDGRQDNADTYVASVNVTQPWSDRLQSSYGAQAFASISEDTEVTGQSANANLSYSAPSMKLGQFDYSWGMGGGGGVGQTSAGESSSSLSGTAQHGVTRTFSRQEMGTQGSLGFSQSASGTSLSGTTKGKSATLSHQGSAAWSSFLQDGTPLSGSLQVEDRRSWGLSASWSQAARASLNAQYSLSWHEIVFAAGSLDFIRQGVSSQRSGQGGDWIGAGFLGLTYQNQKTWGVPRLMSKVEYRLSAVPETATGAGGDGVNLEHTLSPELSYRIGRLRLRALGMFRWGRGDPTQSLQLSINRDFGGTL